MLAGAAAIFEIDIKKVIALSTLRQLGVIIIILGGAEPVLSFFHLLRHAYFKAILFICAGIIIHNIKDYQDIRKIRIISNIMPVTFRVIIVANLRLCGLPFFKGVLFKRYNLRSYNNIYYKVYYIYNDDNCYFFYCGVFLPYIFFISYFIHS
jgi:NADH-ubiquinone oxidoreductase chain 5